MKNFLLITLLIGLNSCDNNDSIKYDLSTSGQSIYNTLDKDENGKYIPKFNLVDIDYNNLLNQHSVAYYYQTDSFKVKSFLAFPDLYNQDDFVSFSNDTISKYGRLIINIYEKQYEYKVIHNGHNIIRNSENFDTKSYYIAPQKIGLDSVKIVTKNGVTFEFKFLVTDKFMPNKDSLIFFSSLPKDFEPF